MDYIDYRDTQEPQQKYDILEYLHDSLGPIAYRPEENIIILFTKHIKNYYKLV